MLMLLLTVEEGLQQLDPRGTYALVSLIVSGHEIRVGEEKVIECTDEENDQ